MQGTLIGVGLRLAREGGECMKRVDEEPTVMLGMVRDIVRFPVNRAIIMVEGYVPITSPLGEDHEATAHRR